MSQCNKCGEEILWLKTPKGRNIPVNPDKGITGDMQFIRGVHEVHFDTCSANPDAKSPRKKATLPPPINPADVWSKEHCREVLHQQRTLNGKTKQEFWDAIFAWHRQKYKDAGNPPELAWADACLCIMQEVEKEMGLKSEVQVYAGAAKVIFHSEKSADLPPESKKKSIFARIKQ